MYRWSRKWAGLFIEESLRQGIVVPLVVGILCGCIVALCVEKKHGVLEKRPNK